MVVLSFASTWVITNIHLSQDCLMWNWQLGLLKTSVQSLNSLKIFQGVSVAYHGLATVCSVSGTGDKR